MIKIKFVFERINILALFGLETPRLRRELGKSWGTPYEFPIRRDLICPTNEIMKSNDVLGILKNKRIKVYFIKVSFIFDNIILNTLIG